MNIPQEKPQIPLVKGSTSYKLIIPNSVERKIRFLCERVWDTEWSGVLFYTYTGNFEDNSMVVTCKDIFPMDIGTTTYTEFNMSPDVISYMAENPELLDCKTGLIHSHNNMATFFSGTDLETLRTEGNDINHFVSLIVNNAGKYTAAITRKIKYIQSRIIKYDSYEGEVASTEDGVTGEEIEWFNLDIEFEKTTNDEFSIIPSRLDEIKKSKAPKTPSYTNYNSSTSFKPETPPKTPSYYEPSLFSPFNYTQKKESTESSKQDTTPNLDVDTLVAELLTGCVLSTAKTVNAKDWVNNKMVPLFTKRFGKGDAGMELFEIWATDFIEFLVWYSNEDADPEITDLLISEAADAITERLKVLPKNKYINKYIELLSSYDRYK